MYDIAIIGGGINGCGIARDAAGRGFAVLLAEMGDLASGTSSWSTKLIHGGLRYLEYYEFRLVREALKERETLWSLAPHVIRPMRFVLPHHDGLRPAWMLRAGLFLYDHLGGRERLPGTRVLNLARDPAGMPLKSGFRKAFEYSDCQVDDARLVILNARDAAGRGADIRTRTKLIKAQREEGCWQLTLRDARSGRRCNEQARLLINAAGPWVDKVLVAALAQKDARNVRLVQGSHIVVPKLYDHEHAYIFQNNDGRVVFAIPFERDFTLIGTTDRDYHGDPGLAEITPEETDYLCRSASDYFKLPVKPDQIVWSFSGVRPLYDDAATTAQAVTRDYVISVEGNDGKAPLINIFGGKLTTYRKLAASVVDEAGTRLGAVEDDWTGGLPLPGGDFPANGFDAEVINLCARYPWLDQNHAGRLIAAYGTKARDILTGAGGYDDLGVLFGAGLYQREVEYLTAHEWAVTAEDILWRRTKLGLRLSGQQARELDRWLRSRGKEG